MAIYTFGHKLDEVDPDFTSAAPDFRQDTDKRNSGLSLYYPDSPTIKTARMLADEAINIVGAEVKVFIRTDNSDYDTVWDEDADPTYWQSVMMKAFYKPTPIETELKKWGADSINKTEVVFSHRELYLEFGDRMLRAGDVIQMPFNAAFQDRTPKNYRVINGTPTGNYMYTWLYFTCAVETLTADISVRPVELDPIPSEIPFNTNGAYRESI